MANLRGEIVTIPIRSANIRKNIKPPKFCGDIDFFCENYYLYIVRTPVFEPRRGCRTLFGACYPRVRGGYADEGVRGYTITQLFYDRRRYGSHLCAEARRKGRGASVEMLRFRRGDIFGVELRSRAELRADIARDIANGRGMRDAEREAEYCRRCGITPVASTDDAYPPLLREIDDYPAVIYVNGDVEALTRRSVAFVGTRRMTSYGSRMCDALMRELSEAAPDVVVVSGLAYGVDSA